MPTKVLTKKVSKKVDIKSFDEQLAEHLQKAEEHLIAAVNLFDPNAKAHQRSMRFYQKLMRAQEMITSLHAEELIRIRDATKKNRRN